MFGWRLPGSGWAVVGRGKIVQSQAGQTHGCRFYASSPGRCCQKALAAKSFSGAYCAPSGSAPLLAEIESSDGLNKDRHQGTPFDPNFRGFEGRLLATVQCNRVRRFLGSIGVDSAVSSGFSVTVMGAS